MRLTLDLQIRSVAPPVRLPRRIVVGTDIDDVLVFELTGKDRVKQTWPLSGPGDWTIQIPEKLGPYERMTLCRLCVALETLGGVPTEHSLGAEFEEDLEALRGRAWPGAISEIGLVL